MSWTRSNNLPGALSLVVALGVFSVPAQAEVPTERLQHAKALFREGNALLFAGDPERALERFLASRDAVASGKNTANAAICLERLGRYDEALEMYEELLARFAGDLDDQDRQNLVPIMARLRAGLGSLDVTSNVEGLLTIDGKARGKVPRSTALRAMPGKRRVRVLKEGYRTFDASVELQAGETVPVDASLEPLSGFGALRVEQTGRSEVALWIDGQPLGPLPWEGTLVVGVHLLQALGSSVGSKPQAVQVIERKTQLIRVNVRPLSAPVEIVTTPATAALLLDGTPLGHRWSGRLPFGSYRIRAEELGYFSRDQLLVLTPGDAPTGLQLELARDPNSSRWPQRSVVRYTVGVDAAFLHAPTLNGDHESLCPSQCQHSNAAEGARFEASLEATHELGFGAELAFGYLFARQSFIRAAFDHDANTKIFYSLRQQLVLGGGYVRAAAVARLPVPKSFTLRTAIGAGLVFAGYDAVASGESETNGSDLAHVDAYGYERISELLPIVTTGLRLERQLGAWQLSLGIDGWFAPQNGPRFPDAQLAPTCASRAPPTGDPCPAGSDLPAKELVHRPFVAILPEAAVRYRF